MALTRSVGQMVFEALAEIRVARAADSLEPEAAQLACDLLNGLIDLWNADDLKIYNENFTDYVITPNLNPHTIGPAGTFVASQRPVSIEAMEIILNNVTPNVFVPINKRDDAWYQGQSVPGITTSLPTDFYYSPQWPEGQIYFWPVPTTAYGARVWCRAILSQVVLTTQLTLPPGYWNALKFTLAEHCASSFGKQVAPQTALLARQARDLVGLNNAMSPSLETRDSGMQPTASRNRTTFNYKSRSFGSSGT